MGSTTAAPKPSDPAFPGLTADDLCLSDDGGYGEIRDASKCSRGQAAAFYASEGAYLFTKVRCTVRHLYLYTRQEVWDGPGRDRWVDAEEARIEREHGGAPSLGELFDIAPKTPPEDWRPDESMACWQFCHKTHPRAIKVYVCDVRP